MFLQVLFLPLFMSGLLSACAGHFAESSKVRLDDSLSQTPVLYEEAVTPPSQWSPARKQATAAYYFLMGEYLRVSGDPVSAGRFIGSAWSLDPNADTAEKQLISSLPMADPEERIKQTRQMVELYPDHLPFHLLLAELYAGQQLSEQAFQENHAAFLLEPENEKVWIQKIILLKQSGQDKEILPLLKKMTHKNPGSVFSWTQISRILTVQNKYKEALKAAKNAWELQTDNSELLIHYARLTELVHGRSRALPLWNGFFSRKVSHEELVARTLSFFKIFGNLEEALDYLTELSKTRIGSLENIQVQRVFLLWELKRFTEAVTLLEYLVEESPYSSWLTYLLGEALFRNQDFPKAIATFIKVSEHSDYYISSRIKLSELLQQENRIQEALHVMRDVLAGPYTSWKIFILTSELLARQNKFEDSVDLLNQGYQRYPLKTRLLFLRGVYEEKAGQISDCIETMREVIAKDPTFSSAYNYLGYLFADRSENLDEAEALVLKALELKPDDGYYLDSLGWVYFRKGQHDLALDVFLKALNQAPEEGVIMEHIADVYRLKEDIIKAKDYYQKALERQLDERDKVRIEKKLRLLEEKRL
ncbi:MAG: tetratricopeptide repeat protein [Deltaproteobacteria bacterium]|nr:tetratricopeptide repeat protein [Deltaproteobacteria bacterium]